MTTLSTNYTTSGYVTLLPVTGSSSLHVGDLVTAPAKAMIIKYIYVSIGAVGCLGNLVVILVMALYTNVTQKVSNRNEAW
jgi:hypothetical protein